MIRDLGTRILPWAWLGALLTGVFLLAFHQIWDRDIFFHLATGQAVLDQGGLLRENIFTWPQSALPFYHNPSWLFQVGIALLYSMGGLPAVVLAKCLVLMTVFAIGFLVLRREGAPLQAAVLLLFVAAMAAAFRFNARPQILSYLFFALFVLLIQQALHSRGKPLLWLAPLMALWANAHSGFIFGLLYLYAVTAGTAAQALLGREDAQPSRIPLRRLLPTALVVTLATFVTPQPFKGYRFLYQHLHVNEVLPVTEYATPTLTDFPWFFALVAVLAVLGLLGKRRLDLSRLMPLFGFLLLAIASIRFIPFFALAALPWAGARLSGLESFRWPKGFVWASHVGNGVVPAALVLAVLFFPPVPAKREIGVNPKMTPLAAFEFLDQVEAEGNFYNSMSYGAAGMFYLYPKYRLFQTSYIQVEEDLMAEAYRAGQDPESWGEFLRRHDIGVALIDNRMEGSGPSYFPPEEWALVFFDDFNAVFLRRGQKNQDLVEKHEYRVVNPSLFMEAGGERVNIDLQRLTEGAAELHRAVELSPQSPLLHLMLGYYLSLGRGNDAEALEHFIKSTELDPNTAPAYFQQAILYRDLGRPVDAVRALERYLEHNPQDPAGYLELAKVQIGEGKPAAAEKTLRSGTKAASRGEPLYRALGNLYRERREFEKAVDSYQQALAIAPGDSLSLNDMGVALGMKGDLEAALEVFDRVLALRPDDPEARRNRAYTLQLMNQEKKK